MQKENFDRAEELIREIKNKQALLTGLTSGETKIVMEMVGPIGVIRVDVTADLPPGIINSIKTRLTNESNSAKTVLDGL